MDSIQILQPAIVILFAIAYAYRLRKNKRNAQQVALDAVNDDLRLERSPERETAALSNVFSDQEPERVTRMFEQYSFSFSKDGSFAVAPDPAAIRHLVASVFPPEHHKSVLAALAGYGSRKREQGRIHLSIIKASGGDSTKVKGLVKVAKSDFRDVISMAEIPNSMLSWAASFRTISDPSTLDHRSANDADLRQFGLWLLQYVS